MSLPVSGTDRCRKLDNVRRALASFRFPAFHTPIFARVLTRMIEGGMVFGKRQREKGTDYARIALNLILLPSLSVASNRARTLTH